MSDGRLLAHDVPLRVEATARRRRLTTPVATSFGVQHERVAEFTGIEDAEGGFGRDQ